MLKTAVGDGLQQLGLQHELLEAGGMDAHIALLLLPSLGSCAGVLLLNLLLLAAGGCGCKWGSIANLGGG